ncbi:MAG: type II secretion system protein [Trueperaceae bacterium]|nr:type II secretion system protein [Trueperaceae bacterium]
MTRLPMVRTPGASREGLTLVEALIAVSILTILLAAVIPAFTDALRINTRSEVRSQAVAAAQTVLDSLRAVPPSEWPAYAGGRPSRSAGRGRRPHLRRDRRLPGVLRRRRRLFRQRS